MRATCNHVPRVLVPNGQKHKDGTPVMVCHECRKSWSVRYWRKKKGFNEWWDKQSGLCAFCGQRLVDDNTTHLDHDHATGHKRGLVHSQCNLMLGGLENAIALIGWNKLRAYLEP